jgi:hypothetical protein
MARGMGKMVLNLQYCNVITKMWLVASKFGPTKSKDELPFLIYIQSLRLCKAHQRLTEEAAETVELEPLPDAPLPPFFFCTTACTT